MGWDRGAWEQLTSGGFSNRVYESKVETEDQKNKSSSSKRKVKNTKSKGKTKYRSSSKSNVKTKSNEKLENQKRIKQQMNEIVVEMKNGNSMEDACRKLEIDYAVAKKWYDKGWFGEEFYKDFYQRTKLMNIENKEKENKKKLKDKRRNRSNSSKRKKPSKVKKQKTPAYKYEMTIQMKQIIALMEKGQSRTNAARAVGIPIFTANTWFIKGKNGNPMYKEFYLNVLRVWESNKS